MVLRCQAEMVDGSWHRWAQRYSNLNLGCKLSKSSTLQTWKDWRKAGNKHYAATLARFLPSVTRTAASCHDSRFGKAIRSILRAIRRSYLFGPQFEVLHSDRYPPPEGQKEEQKGDPSNAEHWTGPSKEDNYSSTQSAR